MDENDGKNYISANYFTIRRKAKYVNKENEIKICYPHNFIYSIFFDNNMIFYINKNNNLVIFKLKENNNVEKYVFAQKKEKKETKNNKKDDKKKI